MVVGPTRGLHAAWDTSISGPANPLFCLPVVLWGSRSTFSPSQPYTSCFRPGRGEGWGEGWELAVGFSGEADPASLSVTRRGAAS